MMQRDRLEDRVRGVVYGQAVGDALGLGTEFMNKREVRGNYPTGLGDYSQMIRDAHRGRWPSGAWTDDTDQMLCIFDSLLEKGQVDCTGYRQAYLRVGGWRRHGNRQDRTHTWSTTRPFSRTPTVPPGKCGRKPAGRRRPTARSCAHPSWAYGIIGNRERGNRECRRGVPDNPLRPPLRGFLRGLLPGHPLDAPGRRRPRESFTEEAEAAAVTYDDRRTAEYFELARITLHRNAGFGRKALHRIHAESHGRGLLGTACTRCPSKEGLSAVIHEGGDADTNGAVAGSLLGARFGFSGIPRHLVQGLLGRRS